MQGASNQQARSVDIRWLVFVCMALVFVSSSAQVMHLHADVLAGRAKHCPICPVLHSLTPLSHAVHIDISFQAIAHLPVCEDSNHSTSFHLFALFSRPPPLA
jgi:hypothetical protein